MRQILHILQQEESSFTPNKILCITGKRRTETKICRHSFPKICKLPYWGICTVLDETGDGLDSVHSWKTAHIAHNSSQRETFALNLKAMRKSVNRLTSHALTRLQPGVNHPCKLNNPTPYCSSRTQCCNYCKYLQYRPAKRPLGDQWRLNMHPWEAWGPLKRRFLKSEYYSPLSKSWNLQQITK